MNLPLPDTDATDNLDEARYIDLTLHGVDSSESESDSDDDGYEYNDDADKFLHTGKDTATVVDSVHGEERRDVENARGYSSPVRKPRKRRKASKRRSRSRSEDNNNPNPVVFVADTVREVSGVVLGATSSVVGATTGLLTAAVAHAPIINKTVKAYVHRYWYLLW
jgi:hypothetical protein